MSDDRYVTHAEMNGFWLQRDTERDGLQTIVHLQTKTDQRIDALVHGQATLASGFGAVLTHLKWVCLLVIMLLAWQVGEAVYRPAPSPGIACQLPTAVASVSP